MRHAVLRLVSLPVVAISLFILSCEEGDAIYDVSCESVADCRASALGDPCSECASFAVNVADVNEAEDEMLSLRDDCIMVESCSEARVLICDNSVCTIGSRN